MTRRRWQDGCTRTRGETKALLKPYGDKLASAGVRFKPSIAMSDNPGHCIVSTAQEENAHLIVMGSRGRGLLRRTLLGSCSDYVTMHSDIPVVLCPRVMVDNTKSSDCRKNMSRN
ncbi:hypothetical protein C0Q70_15335 [Pomacea canaliculata]|uniref:UspA domain-containing protein n=1 Tax=Pomacea canaliculata TaxID=400727 RepID=A0A2T7NUJ3_POMCA|nr:hypothetical protein C0Q70_15335 [Pomacea canaliculata]